MPNDSDVITWIGELKRGNQQAAQQLWDRYFDRLVRIARSKLPDNRFRRAANEEDVALSALRTFMRRAAEGMFPNVTDPNNVTRLLVEITARKVCKLVERETRQKRGGGQVLGESDLAAPGEDGERQIEQAIGREPTPEFVVQMADTWDHLLNLLPDETLRQIAQLRLEEFTLHQIAERLELSVAATGRKWKRIEKLWATEWGDR